ncbi:sugar ABC transporter substrate-binding protein [Clostridium butyricum]|uniref:Sugar ABC transporter substrate-binding protein n=1 Tax=Clostridium butyricum TaxID=1492 RepID=A0A512TT25_CLOBU|nr:ABC transporter substrate-binding protein [Clostridium butyricum]NOW25225.1 multiple sugar transport system substrate-binding protein [Clostridium butyricum]GEQ23263.1 sugar ABC transporter substrate-binding protein [Clostridium butyricum]
MKKVMQRIAGGVLVALMGISLIGCGGNTSTLTNDSGASTKAESDSSDKITLNFSFDQGVGKATQQIVDEFNKIQDKIQVKTILLPQDTNQVHDDFVNKLASGDTSVDVMGLDVVYIAEFASAGWLMDLSSALDSSIKDTMLQGPVEGATYNGKLVAAPWFTNSSVLFYRKDVLEKLGAEVPTTYEGWMKLADKAVGTDGIEYGADFQAAQSEALVCNWAEYVWNNGGDILDADGKPVINSKNNVEATNIMKNLVDKYAPSGVTTYAETESEQVFKEGKSLFIRDWSGFWSSGQDEGSKVKDKIGATSLPIGPNGTQPHSCLGGLDLVVNNNISDKQKEAAITFIKYMVSKETQKKMTLISSQPPVVKDVYTDAEILKTIPFYKDFYQVIQGGKSRPQSPKYAKVSDAIQRNIHKVLTGETDIQSALDTLQNEVEELSTSK